MTLATLGVVLTLSLAWACRQLPPGEEPNDPFADDRSEMVKRQLAARDIKDERVLAVMGKIPRHLFVPQRLIGQAYRDHPLPIGHEQTISQPYIVAFMTQAVEPAAGKRALEIGTGSGYQAAVLAELVKEVYTIEIVAPLGEEAARLLKRQGYDNVKARVGDGYGGWPEAAPFDIIMLTAAPERVPRPLFEQLAEGGLLVAPVGIGDQELVRWRKLDGKLTSERLLAVRFVPMTGRAAE